MKPIIQSLHFNQQSWVSPVRALQRLRADWELICIKLGVPQGAQCQLTWEQPNLQARCSAALVARLRQITPDLSAQLAAAGWGEVSITWAVERSAGALMRAWDAQQIPWVNSNAVKFGPRTLPNLTQNAVLSELRQRLISAKRKHILTAKKLEKSA
jgi:hypothetical protein